jgi:NDP-sugar pyrophosphorylase family protein
MRLGEQPIIEVLLGQVAACGVRRVHIALGHLADRLQAHLACTDWASRLSIRYSREAEPLGTAGPLTLMRELSDPFLVLNGDVLTTLSFAALLREHRQRGCVATVAVTRRELQLRHGIADRSPDGYITGHREKPLLAFDVAMGVYAFARAVVDRIPAGRRFDVPDLLHALLAAGEPIAAYASDAYWMDIGCAADYETAQRDFAAAPERFLPALPQPARRRRRVAG